jgi:nucleotide-binding universal stress UspA family protein
MHTHRRLHITNAVSKGVECADSKSVDDVVVGSHGRQWIARVLLSSVAETVVRRSPVPVTVVR